MWLVPQHASDLDQFKTTLEMISKITGRIKDVLLEQSLLGQMESDGVYSPQVIREGMYDKSTANHKIDEVRFYGGLFTSNNKIHISPYGELLLKYWQNNLKRSKIFIAMLFSVQFPNPYKKARDKEMNIFPFRLIFKLLMEKRLNNYLENIEVAFILYYVKRVDSIYDYYEIVDKILDFRQLSKNKKRELLYKDAENFVKNYVNLRYSLNIINGFGVIGYLHEETGCYKIKSPKRKAPTPIALMRFTIKKEFIEFVEMFERKYSFLDDVKKPVALRDDWIREIYNFVAEEVLLAIGEEDKEYSDYLQLPTRLVEASTDGTNWLEYEQYITECFNLFDDVKAEHIGGPGEPDTLCNYVSAGINFVSDGKATSTKLVEINDGRLKQHREKYNAQFTVVVTPDYRPSAVADIIGTNTCLITSFCFSDLISRYVFQNYKNKRECKFFEVYEIIRNNMGNDISKEIYSFLDEHTGVPSI